MPIVAEQLREFTYNPVFVETGTGNGLGVRAALDAGFKQVCSIEFYAKRLERVKAKFAGDKRVQIIEGDSGIILGSILKEINKSITFWLDAHFSKGVDYPKPMTDTCPILKELEHIKKHHVKGHTILIDDVRCFRQKIGLWKMIGLADIIVHIKAIDPRYEIRYIKGFVVNDILVAEVKV